MHSFIECFVCILYLLSYISCAQITMLSPSEVFLINALSSQSLKVRDQDLLTGFKRKRNLQLNITSTAPEIHLFRVQSDIRYRYSRTRFTSQVVNKNGTHSQEVIFSVTLPETAFISEFVMEIDGTNYKAFVKERDYGKKSYSAAQKRGQSAAIVELTARHSNVFNVNINIKPNSQVTFNLKYEDLLRRKLGRYEQIININPLQVSNVKDLQMVVNVHESENITFLRMISFPNDNEAQDDNGDNKDTVIARPVGNKAHISWSPSIEDHTSSALQGIPEKFMLQYDINVDTKAGQVLIMEDHFVHFFAPRKLKACAKHIIIILDVSGSMKGRKIEQVKRSQKEILMDLSQEDFFNLITFASEAFLWSPREVPQFEENSPWASFESDSFIRNQPIPATLENIEKAIKFIESVHPIGGTNIHSALETALNLTIAIKQLGNGLNDEKYPYQSTVLPKGVESLIILLTDGMPTAGIQNQGKIQSLIYVANSQLTVPIFSMVFGRRTDYHFLRKLSLQNNGFARKIYESPDAALQIKEVYHEISSLLLSNLTFHYSSSLGTISGITSTKFPTFFNGSEIIVAGKFIPNENYSPGRKHIFNVSVEGSGRDGHLKFSNPQTLCERNIRENFSVHDWVPRPESRVSKTDRFFERFWAYMTIKQLIDEDSIINIRTDSSEVPSVKDETPKQQALRLAMQYSFVTQLTCLVVVKPNSSDLVAAPESIYVDRPGSGLFGRSSKKFDVLDSNLSKPIAKTPVEETETVSEIIKYSESEPELETGLPSSTQISLYSDSESNERISTTPKDSNTTSVPVVVVSLDYDYKKVLGTELPQEEDWRNTWMPPTTEREHIDETLSSSIIPITATEISPVTEMPQTTKEIVETKDVKEEEETDNIDKSNMMKVASANPATSKVTTLNGAPLIVIMLIKFNFLLSVNCH